MFAMLAIILVRAGSAAAALEALLAGWAVPLFGRRVGCCDMGVTDTAGLTIATGGWFWFGLPVAVAVAEVEVEVEAPTELMGAKGWIALTGTCTVHGEPDAPGLFAPTGTTRDAR